MRPFKKPHPAETPTLLQLEAELKREKHKNQYKKALNSTVYSLITIAAVAVLVSTLVLPVLQIYGTSMAPTLQDGDIVISVKRLKFQRGDTIAFYNNNKLLIKRVVAQSGDWLNLKEDGTVLLNGEILEEPYLSEKAFGECNIELPYQVPESRFFVMGDHRSVSVDSRNSAVGCVAEEQIVGKLIARLWPLNAAGIMP